MQQIVLIIFMIGMIIFEIAEHRRFTKFSERLDAMDRDYWKIYKAHLDSSGEHIRSLVDIFDSLREAQESINGIIANFIQDTGEATVETAKRINALGNVSTKLLDDLYLLQDSINGLIMTTDSMQTTSDNRWDLVYDHFVNQDDRMEDDSKRLEDGNKHLQDVIAFVHDKNVSIEIIPSENFGEIIIEVYRHGRCVQAALDLITESSKKIGIETAFMAKVGELYTILNKEAENYEHEEMAAGAGASEGVDARNQETQQAEVLSGSPDGKLVQSELAEDWLGDSPEAEEGQGEDVDDRWVVTIGS